MNIQERQDVVWFQYTHQTEAMQVKRDFIGGLISRFPNVSFEDIDDRVNGLGVLIKNLARIGESEYYSWIIAHSFYASSQAVSKIMTQEELIPQYDYCVTLAKHEYPDKWRT
jgi:hypothetical protein